MSDQPQQQPNNLSEIGHLFLSSVRDRQMGSAPRPMRIPPGQIQQQQQQQQQHVSIDLTPEEFATVLDDGGLALKPEDDLKVAPMTAIIAPHLNGQQSQRAREYAAHLCAATEKQVGLIELDAGEFRLSCFDRSSQEPAIEGRQPIDESLDPRAMREALDELSWDVTRWLVLMPNLRSTESRMLLRQVHHWVLLATCDHEGIVSCYRTLKGLSEQYAADVSATTRPRLSVALLDAADEDQAARTYRKLAGVCSQFLSWPLEQERAVQASARVTQHVVLDCQAHRDKAAVAGAAQWQVVSEFISRADVNPKMALPQPIEAAPTSFAQRTEAKQETSQSSFTSAEPSNSETSSPIPMFPQPSVDDSSDVIDLPGGQSTVDAIASAVVRGNGDLIECPVKPPMLPTAMLAVSRDRRLRLVAVAKQGLSDLRLIGRAYQWLLENRTLIGMAVPQLTIDAHQLPRLHVLVDHADMTADILQPLLQSGNVKVHAYRKLKWGAKTGLLLEAA